MNNSSEKSGELLIFQELNNVNEVYRYVQDSEIKKILKETDGIGTVATQATILKELIDSGMLMKKGKNLISSHSCSS